MRDTAGTASPAESWQRVLDLFHAALDQPQALRADLLERECAGQPELRREIESLLAAHDEAPGFLEGAVFRLPDELLAPGSEPVEGRQIGPYRVLRRIGDGGMGAVYLAERADEQFQMLVALKLVKPGMDSEEILRRFRAERQILASLDHPNIARLLDGGLAEDGRPYLVMEYVEDGVPVDDYCERHKLPPAERLRLFRTVCGAVQSAHGRLVVHRDLKPSNILVSGAGEVKLLDFGIAKLLDSEAPDGPALQTRTGLRLLTPECASPEQVRGEAITTTSDVYALGVLLYKLICGELPHRFQSRALEEVARVVAEQEPRKPSAVTGLRPDDLDSIVLMALRKDPRERYASAEAFSEDVQRYLDHRPVLARKETMGYVVRKFVRRHRIGVAAAAVVAASLLAGIGGTAWQARIAGQERDRARLEARKAEQVAGLLIELFESSDPTREAGAGSLSVREVLERGEKKVLEKLGAQPEIQATMLHVLGRVHRKLGLHDRAEVLLRSALEKRQALHGGASAEAAETLHELSGVLSTKDRSAEAVTAAREALAARTRLFGEEHPLVAQSLAQLAAVLADQESAAGEVERLYRRALSIQSRPPAAKDLELAATMNSLAVFLFRQGRYDEAEAQYRQALSMASRLLGEDHLEAARISDNLSVLLAEKGDYAGAVQLRRDVLELRRKWLGEEHPEMATSLANLGAVLHRQGDHDGALPYMRRALEIWRKTFGNEHNKVALGLSNLGAVLQAKGDCVEAEKLLAEALAIRLKLYGEGARSVATLQLNLASALICQGRHEDGERLLRPALAAWRQGPEHPGLAKVHCELGRALLGLGRLEEAQQQFDLSIGLYRKLFPEGHPDLAAPLLALGQLLSQRGEAARAEAVIREALDLRRAKLAQGHPGIAQAQAALEECLAAPPGAPARAGHR